MPMLSDSESTWVVSTQPVVSRVQAHTLNGHQLAGLLHGCLATPQPYKDFCLRNSSPKQTTLIPGRSQDPGVQPYQTVKEEREAKVSRTFVQRRYLTCFKPNRGTRVLREVPANISRAVYYMVDVLIKSYRYCWPTQEHSLKNLRNVALSETAYHAL